MQNLPPVFVADVKTRTVFESCHAELRKWKNQIARNVAWVFRPVRLKKAFLQVEIPGFHTGNLGIEA